MTRQIFPVERAGEKFCPIVRTSAHGNGYGAAWCVGTNCALFGLVPILVKRANGQLMKHGGLQPDIVQAQQMVASHSRDNPCEPDEEWRLGGTCTA